MNKTQYTWTDGTPVTYGSLKHGERYRSPGHNAHSFKLGLPSNLTPEERAMFNAALVFPLILISESTSVAA